jgi:indolepyruvate ferredoxin oxidoreductase beta subunit
MNTNIFITGLGGQGVVTLAKLISSCASDLGLSVSLFNSKGMAQRGGRVTSEIRISENNEAAHGSRLAAGGADILLGMEIGETAGSSHFLKEGGSAVVMDCAIVPTTMVLKKQEYPDLHQVLAAFDKITPACYGVENPVQPYNIYLLGVFASLVEKEEGILSMFSQEALKQAIQKGLKKNSEENLAVFDQGYGYGRTLFSA